MYVSIFDYISVSRMQGGFFCEKEIVTYFLLVRTICDHHIFYLFNFKCLPIVLRIFCVPTILMGVCNIYKSLPYVRD